MKKLLLSLLIVANFCNAQFVVSPTSFNINSGSITVRYGQSANYSLFNPNSDPNLYLFTGLETDGVASTWDYTDVFTDNTTQIPFVYNGLQNCYVATFNIAARNYKSISTNTTGPLPSGLTVNDWYFIIKNSAGTSQSGNLKGSDYGFTAAVLSNGNFEISMSDVFVADKSITSRLEGISVVSVFNMLGQKIKTFNISQFESKRFDLDHSGIFIAQITNNGVSKNIKFQY